MYLEYMYIDIDILEYMSSPQHKGCQSCTGMHTLLIWLCINRESPDIAPVGLDEEGRSKRSAAAKKPRSKQLLCEQDPEAPGLTLEQRRKIRRHVLACCSHVLP